MTTWAVTGATGFVGRHLTRRLVREGVTVRALVRGAPGDPTPGVDPVDVSLLDRPSLTGALEGCDVLVHLAAPRRPVEGGHRPGDPALLTLAPETVLHAALDAGVGRCVFASSTSVYGPSWDTVDERAPAAPATPYARDRLQGDRRVAQTAGTRAAEAVIVRMSEIIGPGSNAHPPLIRAVARGDMRVIGSGRHSHQLLEVRDAARALIAAGRVSLGSPVTVLIVSGAGNTFREWIGELARAVGTEVRFTPALDRPGRWFLRYPARLPGAARLPRVRQMDYHLRPRAYDVTRSLDVLGEYHRASFGRSVEEMVDEELAEATLA